MARRSLADAYVYLMGIVGVIAITLPFVVAVGDWWIDGQGLRGSISSYYYGRTGGWFVGSLFAIAVFFLSYDYYPRPGRSVDNRLANVASLMAIGVALLPTASNGSAATGGSAVIATLHLLCAATLFVLLAIFSLYQFTKTTGEVTSETRWRERFARIFRTRPEWLAKMSPGKLRRNRIYRICGWIIVAALVMIVVSNALDLDLLFWLEAIAVIAFGVSWLVKGNAFGLLADEST